MSLIALTRPVSARLADCELTHLERTPIDIDRAREQHAEYARVLAELGCRIESIEAAPELPDSVFVEDAAVVLDDVAIVTRPGAASRRPETPAVARALAKYRTLRYIEDPATMDGGDVLVVGRRIYVGIGTRTNAFGASQLADIVAPHGYEVTPIVLGECLHLKTAVTSPADGIVLLTPEWIAPSHFDGMRIIEVHPDEPMSANVLRIGDTILCNASAPRTRERLEQAGFRVRPVDQSELAKAEAGLTCCSLIFSA